MLKIRECPACKIENICRPGQDFRCASCGFIAGQQLSLLVDKSIKTLRDFDPEEVRVRAMARQLEPTGGSFEG